MNCLTLRLKQKLAIPSKMVSYKAMILAAGRGVRMRALTDITPKPLLKAGGKALIERHLENLACAGFTEIVVNHAYLGEMIESALGDGERFGVNINYSHEPLALETAGGIANALPLLTNSARNQPFLVVNADIYCEFDFASVLPVFRQVESCASAHLVLVDNPVHHPEGDFSLDSGLIKLSGDNKLTFSGIGVYHPVFFSNVKLGVAAKLAPLLCHAIQEDKITGEHYDGTWIDVGTPERLDYLNGLLKK